MDLAKRNLKSKGIDPDDPKNANELADEFERQKEKTLGGVTGSIGGVKGLGILAGKELNVSQKGLDLIKSDLSQFGDTVENKAMISRIESALSEGRKISGADANFYLHEAAESTLMAKGMSYEEAHEASINMYNVSRYSLYAPEVIKKYSEWFNEKWFEFWGLKK